MAFDVDRRAVRRYAVWDVGAITLFVVLGELSHGANPLTVLGPMLATLSTFLLGWFAVALVGDGYGTATIDDARSAIVVPLIGWVFADVIAQALRATAVFPGDADLSFFFVALIVGGALLGLSRTVVYLSS